MVVCSRSFPRCFCLTLVGFFPPHTTTLVRFVCILSTKPRGGKRGTNAHKGEQLARAERKREREKTAAERAADLACRRAPNRIQPGRR